MSEADGRREGAERDARSRGAARSTDAHGRRPLASRRTRWARALARRLATTRVTPNAISAASVGFAALACAALAFAGRADGVPRAAGFVVAALGCQLRLLCNLLDGMVAIEGGRGTPDGAFWNELPDRLADVLILVGAGLAADALALGWASASFAVATAYVRELGRRLDGVADFAGPFAKPQRMAAVTAGALASALEGLWGGAGGALRATLWLVALGTLATVARRTLSLLGRLRRDADDGRVS